MFPSSILYFCITVSFCSIVQARGSCETGRVYVGSLNETHPDLLPVNGIYTEQTQLSPGHRVFKHESEEFYLYYVSDLFFGHYWVIGSTPGNIPSALLAVSTDQDSPDLVKEKWRSNDQGQWVPLSHGFKVTCVDDNFVTCNTRRIKIVDLQDSPGHNFNTFGLYYEQKDLVDNRPVYRHESGQYYLHYVAKTGTWMVGTQAGVASGSMFVKDYAWRPEYITQTWVLFMGHGWVSGKGIRARCS